MPFLGGRGQSARGYFGGGKTPDAPTSLSATARKYATYHRFYSSSF
jgi:hypothetical protein